MVELHERPRITSPPVFRHERTPPAISLHHLASSRSSNRRSTGAARRYNVIAAEAARRYNVIAAGAARRNNVIAAGAARRNNVIAAEAARRNNVIAAEAARRNNVIVTGAARRCYVIAGGAARRYDVLMADRRSVVGAPGGLLVRRTGRVPDWLAVSNPSRILRPLRAPLFRLFELCDEQVHGALEYDGQIAARVRVPE